MRLRLAFSYLINGNHRLFRRTNVANAIQSSKIDYSILVALVTQVTSPSIQTHWLLLVEAALQPELLRVEAATFASPLKVYFFLQIVKSMPAPSEE